jgi:peptidoglycan/LPS O-acetylase OafA/YrhL
MSQPAASRLDALTSLRFFAAMMIVLFHTEHSFGRSPSGFALAQGVSFFYVLSGFILTLVYPRLDGWGAVRAFWRARFARVWPAYMLALFAGAWLVGYEWHAGTALAYVAMVQSWIPLPAYYFGYNAVGWSVATEWFFYLVFPLLVLDIERTWKWKLAGAAALVLALVVFCHLVPMSASGRVWEPAEQFAPNERGLMFIHPLSRVFEFVCGMCIAVAWRRRNGRAAADGMAATALELGAIVLCAASMFAFEQSNAWIKAHLGTAIGAWLEACGSVGAFTALVYVMALGRGRISRALAWKPLVIGGEISFSIYLLHQPLLFAYEARKQEMPALPDGVAFALYLGVVWLASFVVWRVVEMPARRFIVGDRLHGSSVVTQGPARASRFGARLRPALAVLALVAAGIGLDAAIAGPTPLVRAPDQETPPRRHSPGSCNLEFAGKLAFQAGEPMVERGSSVLLRGWFLSEVSGKPGLPAALRLLPEAGGPAWQAPIEHWFARPDVLDKLQATGTGDAGFAQRFDLSTLAPGTYRLQLLFEDGGRAYDCNTGQRLAVGGG